MCVFCLLGNFHVHQLLDDFDTQAVCGNFYAKEQGSLRGPYDDLASPRVGKEGDVSGTAWVVVPESWQPPPVPGKTLVL